MIRSLLAASTLLAALAPSLPAAAQVTLQNDSLADEGDGFVECGFAVDEKLASVFVPEPEHYPFVIEEVQFMLTPYRHEGGECVLVDERSGIALTVEIYNDDSPAVDLRVEILVIVPRQPQSLLTVPQVDLTVGLIVGMYVGHEPLIDARLVAGPVTDECTVVADVNPGR